MRILHTADWHLGHALHGVARDLEHEWFLDWLLDTLERARADVLLIAGDLFDSANPPAAAQALFYRFVVAAGQRRPGLRILAIAGNHDSPARLEAPTPILDALQARVVGSLRRRPDGTLDPDALLVPLHGADGQVEAWGLAMPFLRPADLRAPTGTAPERADEDPLIAGARALHAELFAALNARRCPGQATIALGHCYLTGGRLSELSERRILGGHQHALPVDIFPDDLTYVALGHLHLAQSVGGRSHVRYSGSPIPLALDERHYPHQVVQIDLKDGRLAALETLRVPRCVEILRFPATGAAPPAALETLIAAHDFDSALPPERYPYLEVAARLDRPDPGLRQRIEAALAGKPVRLLKLTAEYPGQVAGLAAAAPTRRLDALQPDWVFRARYRQEYDDDPDEALLAAFHELLAAVESGDLEDAA